MTTIERGDGNLTGSVDASEPVNVGVTFSRPGRRKLVWIVVGVVLMSLVALVVYEFLMSDALQPTLRAEGCVCPLSTIPQRRGHWHLDGGVWQCLPGVGTVCR